MTVGQQIDRYRMLSSRAARDRLVVFPARDLEPGASAGIEHQSAGGICVCAIAARAIAQPPEIRTFQLQRRVGGSKRRGRRASWLWSLALLAHQRNHPPACASLDSLVVTRGEAPSTSAREHLLSLVPLGALSDGPPPLPFRIIVRAGERVALRVTNREEHRTVSCVVSLIGVQL